MLAATCYAKFAISEGKSKVKKGQLASACVVDDRLQRAEKGRVSDAEGEPVSTQLGTALVANIMMPLPHGKQS